MVDWTQVSPMVRPLQCYWRTQAGDWASIWGRSFRRFLNTLIDFSPESVFKWCKMLFKFPAHLLLLLCWGHCSGPGRLELMRLENLWSVLLNLLKALQSPKSQRVVNNNSFWHQFEFLIFVKLSWLQQWAFTNDWACLSQRNRVEKVLLNCSRAMKVLKNRKYAKSIS